MLETIPLAGIFLNNNLERTDADFPYYIHSLLRIRPSIVCTKWHVVFSGNRPEQRMFLTAPNNWAIGSV